MLHRAPRPATLTKTFHQLFPQRALLAPVEGALQRMLQLERLDGIHDAVSAMADQRPFFEKLVEALRVRPRVTESDLERIPRSGPVVAVANHPFGFIEGCVLAALLPKVRPDVKLMVNSLLASFPESNYVCIYVDPFGGEAATKANQKGLKDALALLRAGGMLMVFPAGEVAHLDWRRGTITDPAWNQNIARLVRKTQASVVPIYFDGANGPVFQMLGLLHPRLRTAMLPHEFFNKQDREIDIRIGAPIPPRRIAGIEGDAELTSYLRRRTYMLQYRNERQGLITPSQRLPGLTRRRAKMIAPVPPERLAAEVGALAQERRLAEMNEIAAFYAWSHEIPEVLREIGRLRETTFRSTGEGTGKELDLDAFDAHYMHLFLWNQDTREVAGAYRLGATDTILARFGRRGLYTGTLFAYDGRFLEELGIALEMGRSFVKIEYQKSYAPLLLLWKGIGAYVSRHPKYKVLFGPVSISNDYQPMSRQLMVNFFRGHARQTELSRLVRARSPFRQEGRRRVLDGDRDLHGWDIEELSARVADIETDQKGLPVLLRQYLKLGGELIGFNVDRKFANVLDGLIVVDLTRTDRRMLERYMGAEGAVRFLDAHK